MINHVVALATLAVITRSACLLAKVLSPKIKNSPAIKPKKRDELEEFIVRLQGLEEKNEVELDKMFEPGRIEQIKKKELYHYKLAQEKKWRNWLDAVSH
jgi:hypothetical protein